MPSLLHPHSRNAGFTIVVDHERLLLKGSGSEAESTTLSGQVVLNLTEQTSFKDISLNFRGRAVVPGPAMEEDSASDLSYTVCSHDWFFHKKCTLDPGRHVFPFSLCVGSTLPSSLETEAPRRSSVSYRLRAVATRCGIGHNYHAQVPVFIVRSFPSDALDYQQTLECESTVPGKLMYSLSIPHKAWAAGDTLSALAKFSPMAKGVAVASVTTLVTETVKVYSRMGWQERTRTVVSTAQHMDEKPDREPHPSHRHRLFSHRSPHPQPPVAGPSTCVPTDVAPSDTDVVALLHVPLPETLTPTHAVQPVLVGHRIHWRVALTDGTQLRCALPLHVLDARLLDEARAATRTTRRLFLGLAARGPREDDDDGRALPSYAAHVRDRVADADVPDSAAVRVPNPWTSPRVPAPQDPPQTPPPVGRPWLHRERTASMPPPPPPPPSFQASLAALSQVPRYEVAAKACVPPLEGMFALPSYA